MIKVLQFSSLVNRYDFIDNIVHFADKSKFDVGVCIITGHSNIQSPVYEKDVFHRVLNNNLSRGAIPQTVWQLRRILREWKPDIIHTHHYDQTLIGYLATRLYPKTKLVIGRHYSDAMYRLPSRLHQKVFLNIENIFNRKAQRIIVPSTYIRDILMQRQNISPEKIDVVPYGFPDEKFPQISDSEVSNFRRENNLNDKIVLCIIGRIDDQKGHKDLIIALKRVKDNIPNIHLLIIGDGPNASEIKAKVKEYHLQENVIFLGWRKDVAKIIKSVDIVVHPSLQEAFSSVMCEALWLGKPLIISDVSGATDIIESGKNGVIVAKGNAELLGKAIEDLAKDSSQRAEIAENGKIYARQNLHIRKAIKRYENSYLKAMNR